MINSTCFLVLSDLTGNYINGSIPAIFGQLRVTSLSSSLHGNSSSDPIPAEIGNIAASESLDLEDNLLEGNLPSAVKFRVCYTSSVWPPLCAAPEIVEGLFALPGSATMVVVGVLSDAVPNPTQPASTRRKFFTGKRNSWKTGASSRCRSSSLHGNSSSDPIPAEIGNIAASESLDLEDNLLEGNLPSSIGNLRNLNRLLLNHFNGTVPSIFDNLRNLTDFRIDVSTLSGIIPEFIGYWIRLTRLDMQGTSMEGPIPARIPPELRFLLQLCIPFKYREAEDGNVSPEKIVEVLMINSYSGHGLLFPKLRRQQREKPWKRLGFEGI
ncbi:Probable LRR receptor-like serine/threonine-protein kinase [Striga hermonthica]|uniref:Probable LRR receptor-like serine/threonine-protein kinase n=1 Tax=Striga hermonthica TaxID=68872 RepID=A0A9N7RMY3_STRHE|nr:Probable LRR receptor-like serine/threonine-protein kinase [Striga hermonthica]